VSGETTDTIQRPACVQAPYRIPTFHAFTQNSIYFFLDTQATPLADSITVQAEASTGQKVTVEIQLDRIEVPAGIPIIHVLAAKALMNDLEIGQSWLHSRTYEAYRKNNTAAFEKAVQQEAESIGKRWSITGKWTSFVAVDKINQLEKTADIYRPERLELLELMRPRGTLPVTTLLDSASFDSSRHNYDRGVYSLSNRVPLSPVRTQSSSLGVSSQRSMQSSFSLVDVWSSSVSVPPPVGVSSSVDVPSRERERYRDEKQSNLRPYSPEGYSTSTTSLVPFSNSPTVLNTSDRLGVPLLSASPTSGYNHNPLNTLDSLKDFNTVIPPIEEYQDAKMPRRC
jgi:hypothetical protein